MMSQEKEELSLEDIRYLKVAISIALVSPDIRNMPNTKLALSEPYSKIERIYQTDVWTEAIDFLFVKDLL